MKVKAPEDVEQEFNRKITPEEFEEILRKMSPSHYLEQYEGHFDITHDVENHG